MAPSSGMNVAVVGAGISGILSAYLLQRRHRVTLFEKNDYIGGHTNTAVIAGGSDAGLPVDTGFIVHNERTYPLFRTFLKQLGVAAAPTDMSFSCQDNATGFHYSSLGFNGFFAQRENLFKPSYWAFLLGIQRFCSRTQALFEQGKLGGLTLGGGHGYGGDRRRDQFQRHGDLFHRCPGRRAGAERKSRHYHCCSVQSHGVVSGLS